MPAPATSRDLRFLDPAVLARLGTMELKARTVVEGFLAGLHRSPYKGFSVEFAEYRQYLPGDDLSTLDWKIYARSDRHYVKKFEEETNLECHVLLDVSASMAYRGAAPMSKLEYGSVLAASLAFLMHRQRDATGLIAFDERITFRLPAGARAGHLHALLLALEKMQPGLQSNAARPLRQLAEALTKRSLVVLISDLLDDPAGVIKGLRHLKFRGTDVIVFQLLDPNELTFPFKEPARFRDVESAEELLADPTAVRTAYLRELAGLTLRYDRELRGAGHRLRAARHLAAARFRAARVPGRTPAAEVGPPCRSSIRSSSPARWPLPFRSCCICCGATSRRKCRSPPSGCCAARRSNRRGASACAICCCSWPASRRCCCSRRHSPGRTSRRPPARRRCAIVALDRSFSMGAPGRFQQAQAQAREAVAAAGSGQQRRGDRLRRSRHGRRAAGRSRRGACGHRCGARRLRRDPVRAAVRARAGARRQPSGPAGDRQRSAARRLERRGASIRSFRHRRRGSSGARALPPTSPWARCGAPTTASS